MITRQISFLIARLLIIIMGGIIPLRISAQPAEIKLQIDGATKYQTMDGFGVNINTAWWNKGEYMDTKVIQPAIDLLVDSLGATIFRAVVEEIDWEAVNDDNDPDNFNWAYYNSVFTNARFQGVWNTLRYLNHKGITNGLIISFMGAPPASAPLAVPDPKKSWMGGTNYSINDTMEDELVESIAALLYYMRHTARIQFTLVSPMNETDVIAVSKSADHPDGIVEGPNIPDAIQYVHVVRKLAEKLDVIGMGDIRFVAPDAASDRLFGDCLDEMVKDSSLLARLECWGVHQYGNDAGNYLNIINRPANPNKSYWVTETAGIRNMLGQLDDNARAYIFWDGFDCVYQHGRRNGYGSVPPNDWVFWLAGDEGKPLIEYIATTESWMPRKQFYEHAQLMKFVKPGSVRIGITGQDSSLSVYAYCNPDGNMVISGRNNSSQTIAVNGILSSLPALKNMKLIYTNSTGNLIEGNEIIVSGESFKAYIPAESVFTITGIADLLSSSMNTIKPEPSDWYAGDMHIHRNCGDGTAILPETEFTNMMEPNDLAVISVLADMGDGEVKDSKTDLPKVNGSDAIQSKPGRLVHWDAEWHFDPFGTTFEHKAMGGHLVLLGLKEAHQIWDESPYKIIEWGKSQNAIVGFCHMQYLNDSIQNTLNCCIPVDYPVEAALGTIDFLAEDVWLNDAAVNAYYKLLNCGFRLGWAAGTDFPCNNSQPFGSLLTYVQVKDQPMTYQKWIEGIKNGRTVVTTNGHAEFLDLIVNGENSPGDEIKLKRKGTINVDVTWTAVKEMAGIIEILCNGKVIAQQEGTARQGEPVHMKTNIKITESSWICARRMDETGHQSHTAPVYITVKNAPIRASAEDAQYFVRWINNTLGNIAPGGRWNQYFTHDLDIVQKRYIQARTVYEKIALEAKKTHGRSDKKSGVPILLLATNSDFGSYAGEILKAEGFNEFIMDSVISAKVTTSYLKKFDLVILAESTVGFALKELLSEFVKYGGNLIAFRPDPSLSEMFGITPAGETIVEGYIRIDSTTDQGKGLTSRIMQFHGTADKYTLNGGKIIATIFSDKVAANGFPGVISNNYGNGHTVAFSFNLPKSIVYTRQGNPFYAGLEKDGIPGLRSMDLFTDGWLDTSNNTINQADEQMVLLSHLIEKMNTYAKPLPRLWYFPDTLKCLVTLTNDGEYRSDTDFEPQFCDVDSMGAKMSLYILDVNKVSKAWVDKWTAKGHEIAGHPDDTRNAGNPDWNSMNNALSRKQNEIFSKYRLATRTNVNHWFVWCGRDSDGKQDFAAEARLEEKNGIELDLNYAKYDIKSNQVDHFLGPPGTNQGNFTGSGLLMKFADANGHIINVYQQLNAVYDQEYNESHDPDGFYNCFKGLVDRSQHNEVYSFISIKSHNDEYYFSKAPLMKMLAYANSNGVPVWTALKLLDFIKMRDEATFTDISWSNSTLSFKLNSSLKHNNSLSFMVPFKYGEKKVKEITLNGKDAPIINKSVKGYNYSFLTVKPGTNYSILVNYGNK